MAKLAKNQTTSLPASLRSRFLMGAAVFARQARADVRLPAFFSDHMVIQREKPVPVWGRAEPGEAVTVSFAGQRKSSVADASGKMDAFASTKCARTQARKRSRSRAGTS